MYAQLFFFLPLLKGDIDVFCFHGNHAWGISLLIFSNTADFTGTQGNQPLNILYLKNMLQIISNNYNINKFIYSNHILTLFVNIG